MDFHGFVTGLHNLTRWFVVIAAIYALFTMFSGVSGRKFGPSDRRAGLIYTSLLDLQLLLGLILIFLNPALRAGLQDFGSVMSDAYLRRYIVEHSFLMILAVVAAHVGSGMAKNAALPDRSRFMRAGIFYVISLLLIAVAIPWNNSSLIPWL